MRLAILRIGSSRWLDAKSPSVPVETGLKVSDILGLASQLFVLLRDFVSKAPCVLDCPDVDWGI